MPPSRSGTVFDALAVAAEAILCLGCPARLIALAGGAVPRSPVLVNRDPDKPAHCAVAALTDKQKDCLRLVLQLKTSKDIARELGISPHTVDRRLKDAIEKLGVSNRFAAAQLLAAHQNCQALACQSPDVGSVPPIADQGEEDEAGERREAEELEPRWSLAYGAPSSGIVSYTGAKPLGPLQKLLLIAVVAIASAFAFGAILAGLEALSRISH
jgi:DNA-binding CsgD family transcriptional regulator